MGLTQSLRPLSVAPFIQANFCQKQNSTLYLLKSANVLPKVKALGLFLCPLCLFLHPLVSPSAQWSLNKDLTEKVLVTVDLIKAESALMSGLFEAQCCPLVPILLQPTNRWGEETRHSRLKKTTSVRCPTSSEPLRPPSKEAGRTKQEPYYVSKEKP